MTIAGKGRRCWTRCSILTGLILLNQTHVVLDSRMSAALEMPADLVLAFPVEVTEPAFKPITFLATLSPALWLLDRSSQGIMAIDFAASDLPGGAGAFRVVLRHVLADLQVRRSTWN